MMLRVVRWFGWNINRLALFLYFRFCWVRSRLIGPTSWVKSRWEGDRDLVSATRVALFVHYDPKGIVHEFVLYYLERLNALGFTPIFVTNGPRPTAATLDLLRPLCGRILWRRNRGYDFGAYKDALQEVPDLDALEMLIIANDSVYGPLQPLEEIIARADPEQADVWGITDSYEHHYHLQTYFLLVHRRALASSGFRAFWKRLVYTQSKTVVIHKYEIGFSKHLLAARLRLAAVHPYRELAFEIADDLRRRTQRDPKWWRHVSHADHLKWLYGIITSGCPLNPSHFFWEPLTVKHRCPFLKRELLTRNPCQVPMVFFWEEAIARVSDYDTGMITRHLQYLLRNRSI